MARARVGRPAAEYSQAARLFELYDRLHRGSTLRAADLARELNLSQRTVQRDLAVLREVLGQSLQTVEQPEPGVRLSSRQRYRNITKWQVMGVSLGMQMIRFLSGRSFDADMKPLLTALRGALPRGWQCDVHELEQMVYVPESGQKLYRKSARLLEMLDRMVDGLLARRVVELSYLSPRRKAEGARSRTLRVHPLCLTVHRGAVYFVVDVLEGFAATGDRRVLLALDRMTEVRVDSAADVLAYPRDFRPADHFRTAFGVWRGDEIQEVRIHVDRVYADAVRERSWHATQRLEELPDGTVKLSMQLGNLDEVADWVLGMGEHARAEAPTALVEKLKARLEQALRQYR